MLLSPFLHCMLPNCSIDLAPSVQRAVLVKGGLR
jgi:hypothetical protein